MVLPGGFCYRDYLRCGAIARFAPVMDAVASSRRGLPVLGICNGFQILCEARLLPGVLRLNRQQQFVCRRRRLFASRARQAPFTGICAVGEGW